MGCSLRTAGTPLPAAQACACMVQHTAAHQTEHRRRRTEVIACVAVSLLVSGDMDQSELCLAVASTQVAWCTLVRGSCFVVDS